ncbi:endonuclease domain-containing protein [Arenibacter lacus]|uniref:endonuclease domain-containing protein n=1 Tax=Arenibacter lacus TaxID=2608629 RepID=UPI001CC5B5FD|nr:endonuclease domain-containing protein [Arenibacter lacus]
MSNENPYYDQSMFKGAPASSFEKARWLRKSMTEAEKRLWTRLKNNACKGLRFRRQHPIHHFIVDFYCHKIGLVVEIDGEYHSNKEQKELDKKRTELLNFQDLHVIRFSNEEVLNNLDEVMASIEEKIDLLIQL